MQQPVTVEIIPVSRFPVQGTIIADLAHVTPVEIQLTIPSLLNDFIMVGDTLPIVIRSHSIVADESECEILVLDKSDKTTSLSCLYGIFVNNKPPSDEMLAVFENMDTESKIINDYEN